jgi:hypothetical protein
MVRLTQLSSRQVPRPTRHTGMVCILEVDWSEVAHGVPSNQIEVVPAAQNQEGIQMQIHQREQNYQHGVVSQWPS